jgi:hypothetical protein
MALGLRPGVEQDRFLRAFDQAREAPVGAAVRAGGRVVVENGDAQRPRPDGRRAAEDHRGEDQQP